MEGDTCNRRTNTEVMIDMPEDNSILQNESIKGKYIIPLCLMGRYLRNIAIAVLLTFIGICFLSQVLTSNPILAQTMTINNITGANHDNDTGRVVVKNIGDKTKQSELLAKVIYNILG